MTDTTALDQRLTELTQWTQAGPRLWYGALERIRPGMVGPRPTAVSPTRWITGSMLGVLVIVVMLAVFLPSLGRSRRASWDYQVGSASQPTQAASSGLERVRVAGDFDSLAAAPIPSDQGRVATLNYTAASSDRLAPPRGPSDTTDRQVVRKATIDIKTPDVRGTFAKALHIVTDATGEFIEDSSLSGEGPNMLGTLTLRVAASRLSDVLKQLSDLGVVTSQTSVGQDVTERVVDTDARLRNEQRIEAELLDLISKRPAASLKEVADLRGELSGVRERIEQITAQKERLARLVTLATVVVVVHADNAPAAPPKATALTAYFKNEMASSWRASLEFLADSLGLVVKIFVGGMVLWILLALTIAGSVALRNRAVRAAAAEPAPG